MAVQVHPMEGDVEAPIVSINQIDDFAWRRACKGWLDDGGLDHMRGQLKEK